ncbi:MAG: nucleoside deaminase [Pelagibacterales bacterium]|nr:nucleoside deaminase [Pelagibacterales bacterium]
MKKDFIAEALKQAKIAFEKDEVPVGAIIVEDGKIIALAHNHNLTLKDPTAHAEIVALRIASEKKQTSRLDNCDLYVTLEPCTMCAAAISLARIRRVYYCINDEKFGAIENGVRFFNNKSCHHKPEIYSGFSEKEAKELMTSFFKNKR